MIPVMLDGHPGQRQAVQQRGVPVRALPGGRHLLFAQKGSSKVMTKLHTPNAPLGYFLCLTNLVFDGYTNAAQARAARLLRLQRLPRGAARP